MAHRVSKCPCVSVVMAVRDGAGHLARSVESILNQSYTDLELIIADCASRDRTPALLQGFHDRDIRVELVERDDGDIAGGMAAALDRARGSFVLFMRQDCWLAPDALEPLAACARDDALDMAFLGRLEDAIDSKGRVASTTERRVDAGVWGRDDGFYRAAAKLYERGLLSDAYGVLIARGIAAAHRDLLAVGEDEGFPFMAACVGDAERIGVSGGPGYHDVVVTPGASIPFNPAYAVRCAHEHRLMMDLLRSGGADADPEAVTAVHRRHVRNLIDCIDNASVGSSGISASERLSCVQSMIDDEDVRDSLAAVEAMSGEFGIMYRPMSQRNAAWCCMGSRLREFVRMSHLPLGFML
ncbi:glycosyltransferase [Collinsella tanakaei]|uniref:glycosyltransferase n=1 Tax=Collinsella tanakaei TaxID=626935 RepID=UPI00195C4299